MLTGSVQNCTTLMFNPQTVCGAFAVTSNQRKDAEDDRNDPRATVRQLRDVVDVVPRHADLCLTQS
jgi:hypothetical protein